MKSVKKFIGTLLACTITLPTVSTGILSEKNMEVSAVQSEWKFDLGGNGTESGYTGVTATDSYNKSVGYGFANTSGVKNVHASGKGALSDAVQFTSGDKGNTFNVDLPKGLYQITVTTGDTSRTSIRAEGMLQLINLTGNNAIETFQIPVTDGQLNLQAVAGRENTPFSISAVEIVQLNDTGKTNPTIWLCGDSTVANYYNTPDTSQHGWGQYLGDYLKNTPVKDYQVRNMAASGQYAKGFVDAGQFEAIETYGTVGDYY
ncbi:MAG: GDSL family lipase, partial [Ruminococcus sp.]|nr:GDSL family lipase [Ruminococcus sp.]